MKQSDLFVGLQFEHLTVTSELRCIEKVTRKGGTRKARVIEVRCVCGTEKEVEAGNFLQGRIKSCGCNGVGIAVRDTESFIRAARETRGDFFDYSEVEYVNSYTSVKIIDPEFGPFWMLPGTHIRQGLVVILTVSIEPEVNLEPNGQLSRSRLQRGSFMVRDMT